MFNKLPGFFKREMIRLSGNNYESISFLIEHFSDAVRTLLRNKSVDRLKPTVCRNKTDLQNFNTNSVPRREVFNAHFLSICPRFPTVESKLKQCKGKKVVLFMCQSPVFEC